MLTSGYGHVICMGDSQYLLEIIPSGLFTKVHTYILNSVGYNIWLMLAPDVD